MLVALLTVINGAAEGSTHQDDGATNQQLQQTLSIHQLYADADPGNYDYAKFIKKITYTGHNHITVKVTHQFVKMTNEDKTRIMDQVQGLAVQVLSNRHLLSKKSAHNGLKATIQSGNKEIGTSFSHNHYRYKWQ